MQKVEERPSIFKRLQNNKSINAFHAFLVEKVRGVSTNINRRRTSKWKKGIKRKKRKDFNSDLNQRRRRQTSNWQDGGIYAPKVKRKNKKVLKQKQEKQEDGN